jgi:trans-aconitate 2-methyltransferase
VADLGCGPGNSTELLIARFPDAEVIGVDSSPDMLRQARERLPRCQFVEGDLSTWMPERGTDLLFGNAVFHWVPDHPKVLVRLLRSLPPGGVLAVQMPDNTREPALLLMEKVAASCPWTEAITRANTPRNDLPRPEEYYDLLRPLCSMSTFGTSATTTSLRTTKASSNGSRAQGYGHFSPHLARRCARRSSPTTPMR